MSQQTEQPLTHEVLDRWRAAAQKAGAPLADELQPGLDDAEIEALLDPLGLRAPHDLRTLWGWGVAPPVPRTRSGWQMHPSHAYLPPARAIEDTLENRGAADWGITMPPSWLVVWNDQVEALCLDCAETQSTPVYSCSARNTLFAGNITEMLERWIALIENGYTELAGDRWAETDDAPFTGVYGRLGDKQAPPGLVDREGLH